jgi:centrosomal CEP192-like protein
MKQIKRIIPWIFVGLFLVLLATFSGWTDSLTQVTSQGAQGANDSVVWAQLGADATSLLATFSANSGGGLGITGTLGGSNSLTAVVCPASPCSWTGGFTAGDTVVWTSDTANSGNGPLTLAFANPVSGVGASIQADGPAQFTVKITAFNGGTTLGSFTQTSDSSGDPTYLGVTDNSGANITSVTYQFTACQGDCGDFAIDTLSLNDSTTSTPTPTPTGTASGTPTPTSTPTPTATPTPSLASLNAEPEVLTIKATIDSEKGVKPKTKKVTLTNTKKTASGASINITAITVGTSVFSASQNCITTLAPGKHCKVSVTFTPASGITYSDTLTVNSDAANGAQSVSLTGIGKSVN